MYDQRAHQTSSKAPKPDYHIALCACLALAGQFPVSQYYTARGPDPSSFHLQTFDPSCTRAIVAFAAAVVAEAGEPQDQ